MRARPAVLVALVALLTSLLTTFALPASAAASGGVTLAQSNSEEQDEGSDSEEGGPVDTDEGSGRADAEVGANEGQTEDAETETGPPWTYQMARMIVVLLILMALAIGLMYWRLVVQRQRHGV